MTGPGTIAARLAGMRGVGSVRLAGQGTGFLLYLAMVGRPGEAHGEGIYAVVGLKAEADGGRVALAAKIKEFAKVRLAACKDPRQVLIVEALPKGPTGRTLKR